MGDRIWCSIFLSLAASLPVLILGGFTSIPGAIIGGLLIGVGEKLAEIYIGGLLDIGAIELVCLLYGIGIFTFQTTRLFGDKIIERV